MIGAVVKSVTEGDKRGISKWDEGKHITASFHSFIQQTLWILGM